jgi:hypothetical protein
MQTPGMQLAGIPQPNNHFSLKAAESDPASVNLANIVGQQQQHSQGQQQQQNSQGQQHPQGQQQEIRSISFQHEASIASGSETQESVAEPASGSIVAPVRDDSCSRQHNDQLGGAEAMQVDQQDTREPPTSPHAIDIPHLRARLRQQPSYTQVGSDQDMQGDSKPTIDVMQIKARLASLANNHLSLKAEESNSAPVSLVNTVVQQQQQQQQRQQLLQEQVTQQQQQQQGGAAIQNPEPGALTMMSSENIWDMEVDSPSAQDIGAVLEALGCSPRSRAARLGGHVLVKSATTNDHVQEDDPSARRLTFSAVANVM